MLAEKLALGYWSLFPAALAGPLAAALPPAGASFLAPAVARGGTGLLGGLDIVPGTKTPAQLSRTFLGQPFQGARFTHYLEIDVTGLNVIQGRPGVFVIPNEMPLNIEARILGNGEVPQA